MKKYVRLLSFFLGLLLVFGTFAACTELGEESTSSSSEETAESESTETSELNSETESEATEGSSAPPDTETGTDPTVDTETSIASLEGEHAELIALASDLKNKVNTSYGESAQNFISISNDCMVLGYRRKNTGDNLNLAYLQTPDGKTYLEETMDVFIKLTDGSIFNASASLNNPFLNIYRYGYYYFENRIEGQVFANEGEPEAILEIDHQKYASRADIKIQSSTEAGDLSFRISNTNDPRIIYNTDFAAADYNILEVTLKVSDPQPGSAEVFIIAGSHTGFSAAQSHSFQVIGDGEFHTYKIPLDLMEDYNGSVTGIRLDVNAKLGTSVELRKMRAIKMKDSGIPSGLSMQRSFLTYSDKLHHLIQLSTDTTVENVAEIGMITEISADTVAKLIVKDKNGLHDSLDGVDWASAEYAGFDIKDVGVFGYILPCDNESGAIKITLQDGIYTILQTKVPANNKLIASEEGTRNKNDFFMGQRIYNDEAHDFDAFLHAAECERHPLTEENITVANFDNAKFLGYQPLYGHYKFSFDGTGFNEAFYIYPNRQYRLEFTVQGDNKDRQMYICAYTPSGGLESAVLLDGKDMLLPVPVEVAKNFKGDGENTIYNLDDASYGESYFPLIVHADETVSYTVLNLYQNWGLFPLKQISSIQFFSPYYHLSTGVTETNCIVQLAQNGPGLPDHRAMSAPFWPTQPQHSSAGTHSFLQYTNEERESIVSNLTSALIDSYGPTYCDIALNYQSSDGRIDATYTHTEMPQTDENRAYYEMTYRFTEDVSFDDFAEDFCFYQVTDNNSRGTYKQVGYLDENNECKVVRSNQDAGAMPRYILGDSCPYFSFFDMPDYYSNNSNSFGYVNLACLIKDFRVIHDGKELDTQLVLFNEKDFLKLSLNLGEITFKKGDTISLNMILMPWGSEELDYTVPAPDQLVRTARENTLLDPLILTAGESCSAVESVFVPKAKTTNGKSAEFTLSGGHNNASVRIYGFDMLTVPMIEELVNGKWIPYAINSISEPDAEGYGYHYDGYMVHYDGDGTYSYSFVVAMDNGAARTFRISMNENFKGWPKQEPPTEPIEDPNPLKVYADAQQFFNTLKGTPNITSIEISADREYVTIQGKPSAAEAHLPPYSLSSAEYADLTATGQYLVFKYRVSAECQKIPYFEFWTSTVETAPKEGNNYIYKNIVQNGQWQVLVIDLAKTKPASFPASEDGTYLAKFLRLDFFNGSIPTETFLDIAYIGFGDDFGKILEFNSDVPSLTLVAGNATLLYDTATGRATTPDGMPVLSDEPAPESKYKKSELVYGAKFDMINGKGPNGEDTYGGLCSYTGIGIGKASHNGTTIAGSKLVISGWAGMEGGIEKYVWSVDGGITWFDCESYINGASNSYNDILNAIEANTKYTFIDREASKINGAFQGTAGAGVEASGIAADLSEYAGQTLHVTFGAVPKAAPDTLCVILHVLNVTVLAE